MERAKPSPKAADLANRLRVARERLGDSQERLAAALGVSVRTWQNWEGGVHGPDMQILAQLADRGISPPWLLLGREPVLVTEGDGVQAAAGLDYALVYIPRISVEASAGEGALVSLEEVTDFQPFRREEIKRLAPDPGNLVVIQVRGESMYPTLSPGDDLVVDLSRGQTIVDGLYAVRVDDTLMVKRVQHLPGGKLLVRSDNPAYEPFTVELSGGEDFTVVGRVIWAGKRY